MACSIPLSSFYSGTTGTPSINYVGYSSTGTAPSSFVSSAIPIQINNMLATTALSGLAPTATVTAPGNVTPGFYHFTITVTGTAGCDASGSFFVRVLGGAASVATRTINVCNNVNNNFNLFNPFVGSTGATCNFCGSPISSSTAGNWSVLTGTGGFTAAGATGSSFNPNGLTPGLYSFRYTIQGPAPIPGYTVAPGCGDCGDSTGDINFVVSAVPTPVTANNIAICI